MKHIKTFTKTFTLTVIALLLCSNAMAAISANTVAKKVQSLYDRTSSMEANFVQTASMKNHDDIIFIIGEAISRAPICKGTRRERKASSMPE